MHNSHPELVGRLPNLFHIGIILGALLVGLLLVSQPVGPAIITLGIFGLLGVVYFLIRVNRDPFWGTQWVILFLPVSLPITGDIRGGMAFFNIRIGQIIVLLTLCVVALRVVRGRQRFIPTGFKAIFWLYLAVCVLSILHSRFPEDSLRHITKFLFVNATLFVLLVNTIVNRKHLDRVLVLLGAGGIIVALSGFTQLFVYYAFGWNWFIFPENPSPSAFFTEYGWYGIYLSILFAFFIPFYLSPSYRKYRPLIRLLLLGALCGIAVGINRGSWISTVVTIAVSLLFLRSRQHGMSTKVVVAKVLVVLMTLVGVSTLLLVEGQRVRVEERFDTSGGSVSERRARFQVELSFFLEHPIIGNGVGTHGRTVLPQLWTVGFPLEVIRGSTSFNLFMAYAYDAGLLGLAVLLGFLFVLAKRLHSAWKNVRGGGDRAYLQACYLALLANIVNSQFNPVFTADFSWAFVALAVAASRILQRSPSSQPPSSTSMGSARGSM